MSQTATHEPLHLILRRRLTDRTKPLTPWQRCGIEGSLNVLQWHLLEEITGLVGTWPTPEVLRKLGESDPLRLTWLQALELAFWGGAQPRPDWHARSSP